MLRRDFLKAGVIAGGTLAAGCTVASTRDKADSTAADPSANPLPLVIATYRPGRACVKRGYEVFEQGGSVLSVVEEAVKIAEADAGNSTVGYGGRPNRDGLVQLDAAIMDGATLDAGSVAAMHNIKHPISVARMVMERTPHVMLVGDGARQFAVEQGVEEEDLLTEASRQAWVTWKAKQAAAPPPDLDDHDTMAALGVDRDGNVAAACTTSGWGFKLPGRVGDSPLIGPGVYADNQAGAAAGTGLGEEIIKVVGSYQIVEFMRQGRSPEQAIRGVLERLVARDAENESRLLAFIAVRPDGEIGLGCTRKGFSAAVARNGEIELIQSKNLEQLRAARS